MAQRHKDALNIQNGGACNIAGMANTLVKACKEMFQKGEGNPADDPAIRLIVHQMASVARVDDFRSPSKWEEAMAACEARKDGE